MHVISLRCLSNASHRCYCLIYCVDGWEFCLVQLQSKWKRLQSSSCHSHEIVQELLYCIIICVNWEYTTLFSDNHCLANSNINHKGRKTVCLVKSVEIWYCIHLTGCHVDRSLKTCRMTCDIRCPVVTLGCHVMPLCLLFWINFRQI